MPEPLLDFGDIGFMVKRIGGGSRAQRMRPEAGDSDFHGSGIAGQHLVHTIPVIDARASPCTLFFSDRQRALGITCVAGRLLIDRDAFGGTGMQRHLAQLAALAMDPQMGDAAPLLDVAHRQRT